MRTTVRTDTEGVSAPADQPDPDPRDDSAMATNKRFPQIRARIFKSAVAATLALATAVATTMPGARLSASDWMPMLPDQDFYDFQLFAPPDLQNYNIYAKPSEGIYFSYDRIYWAITPPSVVPTGVSPTGNYVFPTSPISPDTIVSLNNGNIAATVAAGSTSGESVLGGLYTFGGEPFLPQLNTSWMRTAMGWGNRYEGGWVYGGRGVRLNYFSVSVDQNFNTLNEFAAASPTQVYQNETTGGGNGDTSGGVGNVNQALTVTNITSESPPPDHTISQKLQQVNSTQIWSTSVAATICKSFGRQKNRSELTFGFGPRFIQFRENYELGYESNQYPFQPETGSSVGGGGGNTGGAVNTAGNNAQAGGNTANNSQQGDSSLNVTTTSAGTVLGITGIDTLTGSGEPIPLQTGLWNTDTMNNIVGPEISLAWAVQHGRWEFLTELKFTAGFNFQNNIYRGADFASTSGADYLRTTFSPTVTNSAGGDTTVLDQQLNPPPLFLQLYSIGQSNATNEKENRFVFSPVGEWRFGTKYKVSQGVTLHLGYTGMWMAQIARASTNTGFVSEERTVRFAAPQDPSQAAGPDNPWVVKTSGPSQFNPETLPDGSRNPYFVPNPTFTSIGANNGINEYVFTNGVDFGLEIKY